ncbi:MAG: T9SS type A sorting domain-containing protein [Pseudobacter sp.]|uniref:T9SS type A sorting domain-containing protein n=1 Tax=Pseudobacter sp. TaxID=2045420 RepID=UPI003F811B50
MRILLCTLLFLSAVEIHAQTFGTGNIVVVRIGAGTAMTAGVAQPVFLDEYNPCGELIRSIPLPVTTSGSNKRLTLPPASVDFSEGYISLSEDGQYLALGGYDAATGTASVTSSASTTVNRVVGIIDASANVNTSTAFSNRFSTVSIRSAVTDGSNVWAAGGNGGIVYATTGSTGTSNVLLTGTTGRCLNIFEGQLYASSTATSLRLARVGTGLPTTASQTMTNLPGYPTSGGNPFQFFMARLNGSDTVNVLYIADNNQLKKYSLVSGSWIANGTIGLTGDKYRGLTGTLSGSDVILYALRRNDAGGEIIQYTDNTGHNASFANLSPTIIVQADSNKVFRDLSMAPQAPSPLAVMKASGHTGFRVLSKEISSNATAELTVSKAVQGIMNVYDMNGRLVYTIRVVADKGIYRYPLPMPGAARGLYFATFISNSGEIITRKFIY